jgi:hypothetical protein
MSKKTKHAQTPRQGTPTPTPVQHLNRRRKLFAMADKHAEEALFLAAFSCEDLISESTDILDALAKQSNHYNKEEFTNAGGGVMCACYDAGLALGLAFGLRLRGVR